jgi:hypothetical protein
MRLQRFGLLFLVTLCALQAGLLLRKHQRMVFFQSKMEQYRLLVSLQRVFQPGSGEASVLSTLGASAQEALVRRGEKHEVAVRLPLPIARAQDYRGYTFWFEGGRLVDISLVGPDAPGVELRPSPALRQKLAEREP